MAALPESQPQRSRNARAQARHREKRKAYIAQLEETVKKLQDAMSLTREDLASLPAPQSRIRDLEEENEKLRSELDYVKQQLRHSLAQSPTSASCASDGDSGSFNYEPRISPANGSGSNGDDFDRGDREVVGGSKRRRRDSDGTSPMTRPYLTPNNTPPPSATFPQQYSLAHYPATFSGPNSSSTLGNFVSSSSSSPYGGRYYPNLPSGSAGSSPVYSTHPPFASRAYQPHTYTSSSHIGQAPQPPDYPSPLQLPRSQHHPGYVIPKREEDSYVDETIANMAPSQQQLHNYHMQSEPAMASLSTSMTMYHPGHNYAYQPSPLSPSPGASWPNGHREERSGVASPPPLPSSW